MKKLLLFFFILIFFKTFCQEDAWVYFKDKPNANYYLENPLQMLTQRAIDRRANQNISLNINDAPIHQSYINEVVAATGITVMAQSKWLNCLHIRGTQLAISALINFSFVNKIVFANTTISPLNSSRASHRKVEKTETLVDFNYGNAANQVQMLNGHLVHQQDYTGAGKIIAVLDSGFLNTNTIAPFQRIRNNNQILGTYNFVTKSNDVYSTGGHGTNVLSTIAGYVDNQLVGTSPDAQFYLYTTEDDTSENPVEESNWVEAAEKADSLGVDIITSSLGYFTYDNPNYSHTYADLIGNKAIASQGANIAFSKGIVVVVSAGNSGASSNPHIAVPSEATYALAVGAVNANRNRVSFSSIGPSFDGRIKPDVMAKGASTTIASTNGSIVTSSGTSFSCPLMAGMVACLWQAYPMATNVQIVEQIKKASNRFSNPDNNYGYGIPDFKMALDNFNQNLVEETNAWNGNSTFSVYPNPVTSDLNILFSEEFNNALFEIYNSLGQLILKKSNLLNASKIDLYNLKSGFYTYRFLHSKNTFSGKFVKN
jgi:serine protease AprX